RGERGADPCRARRSGRYVPDRDPGPAAGGRRRGFAARSLSFHAAVLGREGFAPMLSRLDDEPLEAATLASGPAALRRLPRARVWRRGGLPELPRPPGR